MILLQLQQPQLATSLRLNFGARISLPRLKPCSQVLMLKKKKTKRIIRVLSSYKYSSDSLQIHHKSFPNYGFLGGPSAGRDHTCASAFTTTSLSSATSSEPNSEEFIETIIFNCRFFALLGIAGSLAGSIICFLKGCFYVVASFQDYYRACWKTEGTGKVVLLLVEAIDIYLMGTVMLIFGMGLYELFISSLDVPIHDRLISATRKTIRGSNLFGLFTLRERPKWLKISSLSELKTKLGHVIVMILLVGMFEKSKKIPINSGLDLMCFSLCILFSSGSLFLLSKLHST